MTTLELLSPARNADIGIEAIKHGADAVYIGAEKFGARAAAGNSVADIARLARFAHMYRAKVYVTVNTIILDDEKQEVEDLCNRLYEAGCDALIVQDLRLLELNLPPIPLHASTQMDNRSVEQVERLSRLGFEQVVLARELPLEEIEKIHEKVPEARLEVFVHGALCVSLSGLCNASEYLFGRSANRGECAQVCRMEFDLIDEDTGSVLIENRHLLSLKDNCQLPNLASLINAGATSFKIEGRLKGADYVKNVTAAYSQALDRLIAQHPDKFCRASSGHTLHSFEPNVLKSFNRGFVRDVSKPDANIYTPKSMGEPIKDFSTLNNGDGLCYLNDGILKGLQVNNAATFKDANGVEYFRNKDAAWERMLSKPSAKRKIWVHIDVYKDYVSMKDEDGETVSIDIDPDMLEPAQTPQHDNIKRNLSKLGETIYEAKDVNIHFDDNVFIPAKVLTEWRRRLVVLMDEEREATYTRKVQTHSSIILSSAPTYEETHSPTTPLMITKYCLRRQLGICKKTEKREVNWALRMGNGKRLKLDFDCKNCMMKVWHGLVMLLPLCLFMLSSCVGGSVTKSNHTTDTIVNVVDTACIKPDSLLMSMSPKQIDSLVFRLSHHYSEGFNFIVKSDSIMLIPREGEVMPDTCYVRNGDLIAVAAISNQVDTIWIKVAHDQNTMGWIAESELLKNASPDDPISEILYTLSSSRGIWMSLLAAIGLGAFFIHRGKNKNLRLIRLDQMQSPYPMLFLALIGLMAGIYASVQNFVPEYWQEYYFHPSLNPLMLPPIIAVLVVLVWLLIITFIAVCDEVYHNLELLAGAMYLFELLGIGMIVYLLVSWTTLIYIGYLLLPSFLYFLYTTYKDIITKNNEH
mgnify:CR=1 FL=1